jgi:hypothetical protein
MATALPILLDLVRQETIEALERQFGRVAASGQGLAPPWVNVEDATVAALAHRARRLRLRALRKTTQARRAPVDISGSWTGDSGPCYRFDQYGDRVVFEETDARGVTSCGEGIVAGDEVWLRVEAADGSEGEAWLSWAPGQLTGECIDHESGSTNTVRLHQQPG